MRKYLNEIQKALDIGLYRIALICALTLPDICAQLKPDSRDGTTTNKTSKRYENWYNKYAKDKCFIAAHICYQYRCSIVHSAKSQLKDNNKIAFFVPGTSACAFTDCNVDITYIAPNGDKINEKAKLIDVTEFINGMIKSVEDWLKIVENDSTFKYNYQFFMQERLNNPLQALCGGIAVY